MKNYKLLSVVVLFVLCLANTSSLTAQDNYYWKLVDGFTIGNFNINEPVVVGKTFVSIQTNISAEPAQALTWEDKSYNIPILAFNTLTGRPLDFEDAPEPIYIKRYVMSNDGKSFYLIPRVSHLGVPNEDYFYKATVENDGIIMKKIYTLPGVESVVEIGTTVYCNYYNNSKISTFQNDTMVKTVSTDSKYLIAGEAFAWNGKIVVAFEITTSMTAYGIGTVDPETGEIVNMMNQEIFSSGGCSYTVVNDKLYFSSEPESHWYKRTLFVYENNTWKFVTYLAGIPKKNLTTGKVILGMSSGAVFYGQTITQNGYYEIIADTIVVPVAEPDYRISTDYIQTEHVERIWKTYGNVSYVSYIIEMDGIEYGLGTNIIATWSLKTNTKIPTPVKASFNFYPNPATSSITISDFDFSQETEYEIFDMLGKTAMKGETTGTIDISNLKPGMYNIVLRSNDSALHTARLQKN